MEHHFPNSVCVPSRGWFHPIKDFETIKWQYEYLKRYSKAFRTRCINDFLDKYEAQLERLEAFELLAYMRSQVTQKQREKRKQSQAITEARWEVQKAELKARYEKIKKQEAFLAKMRGNVCLN
jgi:hypothetical protein